MGRIVGSYRRVPAATIAVIGPTFLLAIVVDVLASSPPAVAPFFERARAALFPGDGTTAPKAIRIEGVVERAGEAVGRFELLAAREPRVLRETLEVDGTRQVVTLIGDDAWIEDPNGVARKASGDEMTAIRFAHALELHDWVDGDVHDFEVHVDDAESLAPIVRMSWGPEGAERRLFFARGADGLLLPERFEEAEEGQTVLTTLEDWRIVDGVRFPFVSRQSTGDTRFDLSLRTTSLTLLDSLPAGSIAPPDTSPRGSATFTDASRARTIPLVKIGGIPFVKVGVEGVEDLGFLVDTGAAATILSTELVDRLKLTSRGVVEARGAGGSEVARYIDVSSLRLPGVEVRDQTIVALSLEAISAALATPIDGILGYDFLNRFAVEIDAEAGTLALFAPGSYVPRPGAIRLPLRIESNVPRLDGMIEGRHAGSFLLDTGNATSLLLHTNFAAEHGFLDRARDSAFDLSGIGGDLRMQYVVIDSVSFGPLCLSDVTAVLAPEGTGVVSLESSIGNVGAPLFAGRVLAFDYGAGALWVSAEAAAASADSASAR